MKVLSITTIIQLLLLIAACTTTVSGGLFKSLFGKGNDGSEEEGSLDIWDYILEKMTGGSYNEKTIFEEDVDDAEIVSAYKDLVDGHLETAATKPPVAMSERTVKQIIREDRRFLLYNSRLLSGECLPICEEPPQTNSPTMRQTGAPTASPTESPTATPTASPTGSPTATPTASPTESPTESPTATPTASPTTSPTESPTSSPTKRPSANPTREPTSTPTRAPLPSNGGGECDWTLANLGHGFSEATGENAFTGCWPDMNTRPSMKDDSVNLFVGGNLVVGEAVEAEGKIVVMGDYTNKNDGWCCITFVGGGYYVLPNSGQECLVVGGDLKIESSSIEVGTATESCVVSYRSSRDGSASDKLSIPGGRRNADPNLDMSHYEYMMTKWRQKSQFWKNLPTTGSYNFGSEASFTCSNDNVQVFSFYARELNSGMSSWRMTSSCADKTILINVLDSGRVTMPTPDMYLRSHYDHRYKECTMKTNILWNFPNADHVQIGNGRTSEWIGSILAMGSLTHTTSGISGRVIVMGDVIHDQTVAGATGSEFHAMEFNPPYPLPDPDCDDWGTRAPTAPQPVPVGPPTIPPGIPANERTCYPNYTPGVGNGVCPNYELGHCCSSAGVCGIGPAWCDNPAPCTHPMCLEANVPGANNPSTPAPTPASTSSGGNGGGNGSLGPGCIGYDGCRATAYGRGHGASDSSCGRCATEGYQWDPCNNSQKCEGDLCQNSPNWPGPRCPSSC